MCNEDYVPQDAFLVEGENSKFVDAEIGKNTIDRYNKYYHNLINQGYKPEEAKAKADAKMEQYFDMFMARYYKKYKNDFEK